jgi:hypothetical protein
MKRVLFVLILCVLSAFAGASWSRVTAQPSKLSTEDFTEIQRLLYTNHTGYDFAERDRGALWASTYTEDAVLDNPPTHLVGRKEIQAYATDPIDKDPKRKLRHWTTTFNVTPHPEGAILSAFWIPLTNSGPNGEFVVGGTGRYESLVVKTKDGWKLKHHKVISEGPVVARSIPARQQD